MAKKQPLSKGKKSSLNAEIEGGGIVLDQPITAAIEQNYMPYAMSVIVSRALPEIDGFKPSHRKILYTMYKMGLLSGARTKSANIVGQTMKLNPHGDQAIYETMVRLTRGNEALLHPYVDSKGNFGKTYSRDMAYAASRYTEAKLDAICVEFFRDIDKQTVDFIPNYDNQMMEPTLLPASFPSILVNSNVGIAVSMASNICPFHLQELCSATIALLKDPTVDLHDHIKGPDFPGGGFLLYDQAALDQIFDTGRGRLKVRAAYHYDRQNNCIEITHIPPTTTIEAIMDKIVDLIRQNKIREISDMRDETDLSGLKITLDLKRGVQVDSLMAKLFRMTPLEDSFSCNFNLLIAGKPQVLGVRDILLEWISFRTHCVRRRITFELARKQEKLHLLLGLANILVDIDKAIRIVRESQKESDVVSNLMIGFGIDEIQADYVAEIKLRHLNREHILKKTQEIEQLEREIAEMQDTLKHPHKIQQIIVTELTAVSDKYQQPRKTMILFEDPIAHVDDAEELPDYPVHLVLTKQGYFKKIPPQSYRMNSDQKCKESDQVVNQQLAQNQSSLLFFTNRGQVYKAFAHEFEDTKSSMLGDYIPAKLGFEEDELILSMIVTSDYTGSLVLFFENGKAAKIPLSAYETKTRRKKLANAFSTKQQLVGMFFLPADQEREFLLCSTSQRLLLCSSAMIPQKQKRDTQGVAVMTLRGAHFVRSVSPYQEGDLQHPNRFRPKNLPAAGSLKRPEDDIEQLKLS